MNRFRNLMRLAATMLALAGATHAVAQAKGGDEAAIRAQTTSWAKAYNAGDAAAVAALYADAAILAFFTKDIAGSKAAGAVMVLNPKTDVGVSGNTGWESGTYTATVKGAVVETGKFLSVSRKKDGKWLYIRDTWNADAAAPPAAAAAPAAAPAPAAPKK